MHLPLMVYLHNSHPCHVLFHLDEVFKKKIHILYKEVNNGGQQKMDAVVVKINLALV